MIADLLNREKLPKRLALGSDSVREIRREYESRLGELKEWEEVSSRSDYS